MDTAGGESASDIVESAIRYTLIDFEALFS